MDELTSILAGPDKVRAQLLKAIGMRRDGVSRYELSKRMRATINGRKFLYYDEVLNKLIEEQEIILSYCGLDNHRIAVYTLNSSQDRLEPLDERTKECRTCKEIKQIIMFRKRPDSRDGHCGQCRRCENERRRANQWYERSQRQARKGLVDGDKTDEGERYEGEEGIAPDQPRTILRDKELKDAMQRVRAQSIEDYQKKYKTARRYVVVDDRAVPVRGQALSPIEEYDRAWRRIRTKRAI